MSTTKTIRELTRLSQDWLKSKEVEDGRLDVEMLLAHVLDCRRLDLYMDLDRPLVKSEVDAFRELLRRRGNREPLSYILGERGFYSLLFKVSPAVLIPRPETEFLVDFALERLNLEAEVPPRWADIGTGSGCIAISIKKNAKRENVGFATDISKEALAQAKENAEANEVEGLTFLEGSLCEALKDQGPLHLIVSNPPYISPSEKPALTPEVMNHEPSLALFDDTEDGMGLTLKLARQAKDILAPGGFLAMELGAGRGQLAIDGLTEIGYRNVEIRRDYGGHDRVVIGQWPAEK
ncbi:MAG: peptide chain release factor N(5)-glutamine methyltransferase [Planctomycetota bacterium]|nr:peptide chain release factor N(5)-glutamine methyltransferase [Planctomycetota bacterium]